MFTIWIAPPSYLDDPIMPEWTSLKLPLAIFIGGGAGAVARWAVSKYFQDYPSVEVFPWPTFLINVMGSLLLGILVAVTKTRPGWYALLGTGFCGGFTTFSTFSVETLRLLETRPLAAAAYAVGSVLSGVLGAWLGFSYFR